MLTASLLSAISNQFGLLSPMPYQDERYAQRLAPVYFFIFSEFLTDSYNCGVLDFMTLSATLTTILWPVPSPLTSRLLLPIVFSGLSP